MSERAFYEERAKSEAKAAVAAVEAQTSAEIVVCLRGASATYREADYLFGFLCSLAALVTMFYVKRELRFASFPLGAVAAFTLGAMLSSAIAPICRVLVMQRRKLEMVRMAACEKFVDLGVTRTAGRTGVLLYISMFERRVEVVADIGIEAASLGPEWKPTVEALSRSLSPSPDVDRFLSHVRALGPILAKALPRTEDDDDETPD